MKKLILILAGVLTIQLFVPACKKYRSERDEMAEYVFVSTAGTCSGAVTSGQYYAGIALMQDHKISLRVNVTKVGRFTINTTSVNGVQFSATGKFSSTGMQTVTLQGKGMPEVRGNFTYNTNGTSGCTFPLTVVEKSIDYAVYTVFETSLICQEPALHGPFTKGVALSSTNRLVFKIHVTAPGAFVIFTNNVNGTYFSASGNFTTTGDQTVSLYGSGTPADAGIFYFNLHAGNGSCSFKLNFTAS